MSQNTELKPLHGLTIYTHTYMCVYTHIKYTHTRALEKILFT